MKSQIYAAIKITHPFPQPPQPPGADRLLFQYAEPPPPADDFPVYTKTVCARGAYSNAGSEGFTLLYAGPLVDAAQAPPAVPLPDIPFPPAHPAALEALLNDKVAAVPATHTTDQPPAPAEISAFRLP